MKDHKPHILLVEDEPNFGSVLSQFLKLNEFEVTWAKNGAEAWSLINTHDGYDGCVLDIMMPEMDGFELGKEIKQLKPNLPFVYLTAKSLKEDMIVGYEIGADDFITKPFDSEILVLKLKALLSRGAQKKVKKEEKSFQLGQYSFNSELRLLQFDGSEIKLSPKENALLLVLSKHKGTVISREEIITQIWDEDSYFTRRSMDVYMAKLRKYLKKDPQLEITSLHAGGYMLKD